MNQKKLKMKQVKSTRTKLKKILLFPLCIKKDGLRKLLFPKKASKLRIYFRTLLFLTVGSYLVTWIGQVIFNVGLPTITEAMFTPRYILRVLITAPIIEELLFRGVLLSLFTRRISWLAGNSLTSLLFAVLHGQAYFFPFFLNSWLYGWSKKESGTIIMPILLHMSYNLIALGTNIFT